MRGVWRKVLFVLRPVIFCCMDRVSADGMEELERVMIDDFNVSEDALMELAGLRIAEFIRERFSRNIKIAFICGRGGNGGDGFVAARILKSYGFNVQAFTPFDRSELSSVALSKLEAFERLGEMSVDFPSANVYVDALLGYGMNGGLRGPVREACISIRDWSVETVSVDVPTGLDVSNLSIDENAVRPDYTLTFGVLKQGMTGSNSGEIFLADIGFPSEAYKEMGVEGYGFFRDCSIVSLKEAKDI